VTKAEKAYFFFSTFVSSFFFLALHPHLHDILITVCQPLQYIKNKSLHDEKSFFNYCNSYIFSVLAPAYGKLSISLCSDTIELVLYVFPKCTQLKLCGLSCVGHVHDYRPSYRCHGFLFGYARDDIGPPLDAAKTRTVKQG